MSWPGVVRDPSAFADAVARLPVDRRAAMRAAMLVDPMHFGVAEASATDNVYMDTSANVDVARARAQLHGLADRLLSLQIPVLTLPGVPGAPDAVFPNNVFAFAPRRLVIGRMRHEVRQREAARTDVRPLFGQTFGLHVEDLSGQDHVGELTGVLAIDRSRGAAVCGLSSRVDAEAVSQMHDALDLRCTLVTPLVQGEYHLNIVMAVLAGDAVVLWDDGFADPAAPEAIARAWSGRALHLSEREKNAFAGNCIAVTQRDVLMSTTAWEHLATSSRTWFTTHGFVVHPVDVDAFEAAGGSLRCLVAEVF